MPTKELPTYDIKCPKCARVVSVQPICVTLYIEPKFKCKFCDHTQRLVVHSEVR